MTRWNEFLLGVRRELPMQLGVVPFGMIYGVLAVQSGMSPLAAQLSSSIVFAGSAQLVIAQMLAAGGSPFVILLTAIILNVRHVLYSASLGPHVGRLPRRWRLALAYLLTDEAYAVAIGRYVETAEKPPQPDERHWHFLGAGLTLWSFWNASTLLGVTMGAQLSPAWGLDFAIPLTFVALLVPSLGDGPSRVAALFGAVASVVLVAVPLKLGLFCAMLVGIAAGAMWEVFMGGPKPSANPEGTRA
ncbi:AzlC family ABC transporter permease [Pendulispora rubella]|uniref:AzlC family ABC transporter permease n=1 Tax=Pendulispora rubella TaxID=2741070 RepID=A0ABZ2LAA2_9BACT